MSLTHYFTYAFIELFFAFVSIGEVKAATSEATLPLKFAMICRPAKTVAGAHEEVGKQLIAVDSAPIHEVGIELNAIGILLKTETGLVLFDGPLLPYIAYEICRQHRKTRELFPAGAGRRVVSNGRSSIASR